MATLPSDPPDIIELPPAPNSATDTPSQFDIKANSTVAAQVDMIPQINTANDWVKTTAEQVYNNAVEAANSASSASESASNAIIAAQLASEVGSFIGEWSSLSGFISLGSVVSHNDSRWQAKQDINNVELTEPSLSNSDWVPVAISKRGVYPADSDVLSSVYSNIITSSQSNPLPLANSVPAGTILKIIVPKSSRGITTTHLVSGLDSTTDDSGNSDGFIFYWPLGGSLEVVSNGLNNWEYI